MKKSIRETFKTVLNKYSFYRDINEQIKKFDLYELTKWKFRLMLFWYEQVLNYIVVEEDKSFLSKALTVRNKDINMSLTNHFKNKELSIVKIQKKKNNKLVSYKLYILAIEDNKYVGIKCDIL